MFYRSTAKDIFLVPFFFDIEALSDHTSSFPHMMPRPEAFAVAMRELGVNQDKHLIVYDEGNLFSAPRACGCCALLVSKEYRFSLAD